jgi:hypothetical protein
MKPAPTIPAGPARAARAVELILAFAVAPALLALGPRRLVSLAILAAGALCAVVLARDPSFPRRQLFDAAAARAGLGRVLRRTVLVWTGLLALTAVASPDTLFEFPRTRPGVWLAVMCLYPLSGFAQELIFRTFFFHRYRDIFAHPRTRVLASGLIFGWAHIVVNNLAAVPLSAVAGVLFARTYERSRSTLLVSIEHALYGDFVFTIGLGALFYSTERWLTAR